jgi:hypothetical protein
MPTAEDRNLVSLTKICLLLPETVREHKGSHASFLVRKKPFAYYLNDHHGDGIVAVAFKVAAGENVKLSTLDRDRFYLSAATTGRRLRTLFSTAISSSHPSASPQSSRGHRRSNLLTSLGFAPSSFYTIASSPARSMPARFQ